MGRAGLSERATRPAGGVRATADAQSLLERAFARAAGAPLVGGNRVGLLRDGRENYPAWLAAIAAASRTIHFESYIIHDDEWGQRFADALVARARDGVRVRLLYDWLGALGTTRGRFWRRLREQGVEVRAFNPPRFTEPFGWVSRDHRKTIVADGRVAFVTGLCVGRMWMGDPRRPGAAGEPWRDTGIVVEGPAVADVERAFARAWAMAGPPVPAADLARAEALPAAGAVAVRVIATEPETAGVFRLDQLIAAAARHRLWLTDAYFAPPPSYVQALVAAARDGVDVRLLVPGATDIPVLRALSRAGYRALLEGGIRVFEWNGSMVHAKTAVADGCWARVGSTNLNLASWLTNWELDVAVEDAAFAGEVEAMYEADLRHSTEIVLGARQRVVATRWPEAPGPRMSGGRRGSAGRVLAGAVSLGTAVDLALVRQRSLGAAEVKPITAVAVALFVVAVLAVVWPRLVAVPLAVVAAWVGAALLIRAYRVRADVRRRRRRGRARPSPGSPPPGPPVGRPGPPVPRPAAPPAPGPKPPGPG